MRKNERDRLIVSLRHTKTGALQAKLATLKDWEHNHAMKINSWFWTPGGNCAERARKERYYDRDDQLRIGETTIEYWSNCEMSRAHVYWDDGLSIAGSDTPVTFRDVRILIDEIKAIITDRAARATA